MKKIKKFTILHSNDMHGDFFSEVENGNGKLIGGLALLSGYINKVRAEEKNVLYVIAGDMVQGSIIDTEYKGISTIEIMNYLAPDVVALGNHEFDYGLPHLLFLEKMANFPIVSANLYIKKYFKRLMQSHHIVKKDGFEILFTGIITEKIMDALKQDELIGGLINLEDASREIGKISNAYKNSDIDLSVVLTHIGYESDLELAKMLKPEWGIDMIIGGHSHTILEQPAKVNNILVTQAGVGTNQIGRFDIEVDDATNSIIDYKWQLIAINNELAEPDKKLIEFINTFKKKVDEKYSVIIGKTAEKLTHPKREIETTLGNLIADAVSDSLGVDVAFVGSGSIRSKELGPTVTMMDFMQCLPYDDSLNKFTVNGKILRDIFCHIMRIENRDGEGECYQVSSGVEAIYDDNKKILTSLKINGDNVEDDQKYSVVFQGYHVNNALQYLSVGVDELSKVNGLKVVSTSIQDVVEEYLRNNQNISEKIENRLVFKSQ